jgi:WD40 repeat protein
VNPTARHGIFISYARRDGKAFAANLRERLRAEAPDIRVWQDLIEIEGGTGWWRQIEAALERVEFLVIVMTDGVLESETTRREWRHARQQGLCVYPVKGPGFGFSDPRLPRWMKKAHCYDLDEQWQIFLAHLRRGCQTNRVPFMAPDLPSGFVPRPNEFGQLKGLLLDSDKRDPIAITTALTGAGGFGKTTIASALCHDDDVGLAFDDGILWTTLGEQPKIDDALAKLYVGLTGERPTFRDTEDAANSLTEKLEHKNCLIVIDDVWNPSHLKPFLRGGAGCARLITTRMADVAGEAKAKRVAVDEMKSDEAVRMLAARLEEPPADMEPLRMLAHRLGEWPLLLKLVSAAIARRLGRGDSFKGALSYVNAALDRGGVTAFDRSSDPKGHGAVAATVDASVRLLAEEEQQRYAELAVFPEDEAIPMPVVADIWRCDEFETERLVSKLADASLVECDLRRGAVLLHDVLRAYLARSVGTPGLAQAHARLVDRWGDLRSLPHGYAWRWIGYHLAGADREQQLHDLLLDLHWLEAKLGETDIASLLREFDYAMPDPQLLLLRDALRLSSHVIARGKSRLAQQLLARIPEGEVSLRRLIIEQGLASKEPWLRPLQPQLSPPGGPLLRTLDGDATSVTSVALTADGKRAVSASYDGTLKLWDLEGGRALRTFKGHSGWVTAVALTVDGKYAVSASFDKTMRLWDLESGRELRTFKGHTDLVRSIALTPDGRLVVSASDDKTLKLWDLDSARQLRTLEGHTDWVRAVAVDRKRAVSASDDGTLKLWDLESGHELRTFDGHTYVVNAIALTADGKWAVSASVDKTLKLWDLETGRDLRTFEGHAGPVTAVALTAEGMRAVSASDDGTLKLWDLESGSELRTFEGHTSPISAVALTPNGKRAVSASDDKTLKLWDVERSHELHTSEGHTGRVTAVALTADGKRAVSASDDTTLGLWDLESGRKLRTFEGHAHWVRAVALTGDGKRAVSAGGDGTLKVWDLESGREVSTFEGRTPDSSTVALTPDGKHAVVASLYMLVVWHLESGVEMRPVRIGETWSGGIVLAANGKRALSADGDGTLKLWDLESGGELRSFEGHLGPITSVALTVDGKRAVSAGSDRTLRLWDLGSGRQLRTLKGHTSLIRSVTLTADGKHALSISDDNTLKLWDLESGRERHTFKGHTDFIRSIALTPDGTRAVSASDDRTIAVWDLEGGALVASFGSDSAVFTCAVAPNGRTYVAGDAQGCVHILVLENAKLR